MTGKIEKMKVIIEIPDNEATFAMKVLNSLSFVKKVKPVSPATVDLWENLIEASQEVRLHKQGKLELKSAQEIHNEL